MGSFSWTRADLPTGSSTVRQRSNFTDGDKYKILIPKEFGGGYIADVYFDYGEILHYNYEGSTYSKYIKYVDANKVVHSLADYKIADLYGLLAYFNSAPELEYRSDTMPTNILSILRYGQTSKQLNRHIGIEIGCYDYQIDSLKYPLKLVSANFKGTYETCFGRSYGDPNQGFHKGYWNSADYKEYYEKLKQLQYEDYENRVNTLYTTLLDEPDLSEKLKSLSFDEIIQNWCNSAKVDASIHKDPNSSMLYIYTTDPKAYSKSDKTYAIYCRELRRLGWLSIGIIKIDKTYSPKQVEG